MASCCCKTQTGCLLPEPQFLPGVEGWAARGPPPKGSGLRPGCASQFRVRTDPPVVPVTATLELTWAMGFSGTWEIKSET